MANQDIKATIETAAKETATAAKKTTASTVKKATTKAKTVKKSAAKTTAKAKKVTAKKLASVEKKVEEAQKSETPAVLAQISANLENAQVLAKQVWFAGLGAFGRTVEEVKDRVEQTNEEIQARYSKLNKDGQDLVKDLVVRGEKVQDEAQERLQEGRATVEEQIEAAKSRLVGFTSVVDIPARLQDLSDKLESLSKDLKKSA